MILSDSETSEVRIMDDLSLWRSIYFISVKIWMNLNVDFKMQNCKQYQGRIYNQDGLDFGLRRGFKCVHYTSKLELLDTWGYI